MTITPLRKKFGAELREILQAAELRQQDLADVMGLSCSAISQMLSGKIVPNMQQLDKICEFTACDGKTAFELRNWLIQIKTGVANIYSPLNEAIRLYRTRRGLNISKLSKLSGIPMVRLTALENEPDIVSNDSELHIISSVLECDLSKLREFSKLDWMPIKLDTCDESVSDGTVLEVAEPEAIYKLKHTKRLQVLPLLTLDELYKIIFLCGNDWNDPTRLSGRDEVKCDVNDFAAAMVRCDSGELGLDFPWKLRIVLLSNDSDNFEAPVFVRKVADGSMVLGRRCGESVLPLFGVGDAIEYDILINVGEITIES